MKKALCALLAAALIFSLALIPAGAADSFKLELRATGEAAVGGTLTVELWCSGNPGFSSAQFTLSFNSAVLECTACTPGELLTDMMSAANPNGSGGAVIAAAGTENTVGDGLLARYSFNIVKAGDCGFELINTKFLTVDGAALSPALGTLSLSAAASILTPEYTTAPTPSPTSTPESAAFTDTEGHWAEDSILALAGAGIVNGYPDGGYRPEAAVTRAQFVTALWRSMGSPQTDTEPPFIDLSPEGYYREALAWAAEEGITLGISPELFKTHGHISRQEAAAMLHRASGSPKGGEMVFGGIYDKHYEDSASPALWARDSIYWAIYEGLWCGADDTVLRGEDSLSRAGMAVMLAEFTEVT